MKEKGLNIKFLLAPLITFMVYYILDYLFFGQLFSFTKLGFLPSVFLGALLFAFIHIYQIRDAKTLLVIFIITFLCTALFAWLYYEWNYKIWIPIFTHGYMNLFWMIFSIDDNALGGFYPNILRIVSLILLIGLTIVYKIKIT